MPDPFGVTGGIGLPSDEPAGETPSRSKFSEADPDDKLDADDETKNDFLAMFLEDTDTEIHATDMEPEFIEVDVAADSGAGDNVASRVDAPGYKVLESEGSQRGQCFTDAGGHRMKNQGEVHLKMEAPTDKDEELNPVDAVFQIADVCRPLMSVSRMCDRGDNTVTFDKKKAVVRDSKGRIICVFHRKGNLYVGRMKVRNPKYQGFGRQGS